MWSIFGRRLSLYRCTYNAAEIGPGIVRKSWFIDNIKQTIAYKLRRCGKATVRPVGCDCAKVRPIGNVCYDLQQLIRRSISTRGCAITNDWRISMARAIEGNRATSGSDPRPMYDQLLTTDCTINRGDRAYDQSWRPATDRTSNRGILHVTDRTSTRGTRRPIVRSIVGCTDRSHDATIDRAIDRCELRPIVGSIVTIVASNDRSYDQS